MALNVSSQGVDLQFQGYTDIGFALGLCQDTVLLIRLLESKGTVQPSKGHLLLCIYWYHNSGTKFLRSPPNHDKLSHAVLQLADGSG